jgi:hypothetical protein
MSERLRAGEVTTDFTDYTDFFRDWTYGVGRQEFCSERYRGPHQKRVGNIDFID